MKISLFIVLGILMLHAYSEAEAMRAGIKEAEPDRVCMVNDAVMGRPQIPVDFEGKTYYGCCAGCVERLKSDRTVRYAVDPVTGKEVDKARAVILEGPGGEAIYFESADSAVRYRINAMK
ncbi:MAG: hypothetical protein K8I01_11315 [Candidatus Methylomirabilis sp.]|nr:hypothetical protein [Deltaproteobacteria bacterium]